MKLIALGLLVLAAAVYLSTLRVAHDGVWGFVNAGAEAAMVGALADWFAVTALFRHPLGIPVPHTAIIPRRKDDIARNLQAFFTENFLTEAAGLTTAQISSWIWALSIGMALTTIGLTLRYRTPIVIAWSTPGAALLVSGLQGVTLHQAIGVFIFANGLMVLCGLTGLFARLMKIIPHSLAAAMLAGILLRFGLQAFATLEAIASLPDLQVQAALGAVFGCPAHDQRDLDFARAFDLPVKVVVDTTAPVTGAIPVIETE